MKKKLCVLFAALLLLMSAVTLSVSATQQEKWIYNEENNTLVFGNKVYYEYPLYYDMNYMPNGKINLISIQIDKENEYDVEYVAVGENSEIVSLYHRNVIYTTEQGKIILDNFKNGNYSYYLYSCSDELYSYFNKEDFEILQNIGYKTEIDVTQIYSTEIHYIRGFDQTGTYYHNCGAVYELGDAYYYIDYDSLDNSYFDAYGNFSYRRGTAPATKLDGEALNLLNRLEEQSFYRQSVFIYPDEKEFMDNDDKIPALATFITISLIFGLIIPLIPFILSIKFANSKKAQHPKRWYTLTVCSSLWIIIAAVIVLIIVV